jgi:uroporphyrinogen-III synthase
MPRPIVVLRPEPGNAATATRVEQAGLVALRLPLFCVAAVAWTVPDPAQFDALLLTSANAVRHGGEGLARLRELPVVAVGEATARAARAAGFTVLLTGSGDAASVTAATTGRLLHLAGREHHAVAGAMTIVVYATEPLPVDGSLFAGSVALVHSARAAARLAAIVEGEARESIVIAALSPAVAAAAGDGWRAVEASDMPRDEALVALAVRLAGRDGD